MKSLLTAHFRFDSLQLRTTMNADVEPLVALINQAYSYQDTAKGAPRTNIDHLKDKIGRSDFYTLLDGSRIIGCVYLDPQESTLHFGLLTLDPDYRGKGIATELIAAIDRFASQQGFDTISLDYMSLAPWLKQYYQKHGYSETGQVVKWGNIDLIQMTKPVATS